MELALPGEDDPRRQEVRGWVREHPKPTGRQLAEAGYVVPHWPAPWGLDAHPITQLIIDDELQRAGVRRPANLIGIGWAGPTIVQAGTQAQKDRWLLPLLSGDEIWCQLFSEPGAGSDLASLTTQAVRDGDEWVIRGQKVWTSYAHLASFGILLARTDPDAPKHRGISYFVCPMKAEGVTIRPLVDMTGHHSFNEVFLDDVRIPADHMIGTEHEGWDLARVTLGNERVSLSTEGSLWGRGPTADDLVDKVKAGVVLRDPTLRDRLVDVWAEGQILSVLRLRMIAAALSGRDAGSFASVRKALADDHGKRVMNLGRDMAGPYGALSGTGVGADDHDAIWSFGFLFSPALTVGGGTAQVQRNIVAERLLGLPREVEETSGQPAGLPTSGPASR